MGKYKLNLRMIKKNSRKTVKNHYLFFIFTCLLAAFVGSEFTDALTITNIDMSTILNVIELPSDFIEGTQNVFGHTEGVFAGIIESFASGTIYVNTINGIISIVGSDVVGTILFIFLCLFIALVFWVLLSNMFSVLSRRIFLEGRTYQKLSPQRFLYLFYTGKWVQVSKVMLVRYIYNALWYCVFIVGGIVKRYSYFLVPHILAENPTLTSKQAITLSRKMMKGHKWQCFLLELSFFGWMLLRVFTIGLSGVFYSNAYQIAAYTEFYVDMRAYAKKNNIPNSELLNDIYLYTKADSTLLHKEYKDIVDILQIPMVEIVPKNTLEKVLNYFGIAISRTDKDDEKELLLIKQSNAKPLEPILLGLAYPTRLFPIKEKTKNTKSETTNYMMKYTIPTLIMLFFIFSFVGWTWEVVLHFITDGVFVNRGTMHGPWLPIYGSGCLLIMTLLYKLRKKALVQFIAAIILCGIVEYFTAYYLELIHNGAKWWDYTGYFLNLHGRICGEGLLVFGLGGIAVVYVLAPMLESYIRKINPKLLIAICCILVSLFVVDSIYSKAHPNAGEGITSDSGYQSSEVVYLND